MGFMIVDTAAEKQRADEYQAAVDRAQRGEGAWPEYPRLTPEEQEFQKGIASSESVYRNFNQPSGLGLSPTFARPTEAPPGNGGSKTWDESMPSRSSFEQENNQPFTLKGK
jgi:hypothetical protein